MLVPDWLVRAAVAGVWVYEGLWCKLLGGDPNQVKVVEAVPTWGPKLGRTFLTGLGAAELTLGLWALSGWRPLWCAVVQTALLVTLNASGLLWSRHLIHDPPGMVVKNFAFLVLAWVAVGMGES
ncbi:MAG TPA: DoxX-like family protein [Candidatus Binatia bacterium]|nr:DoxX-like family protein [Candidatus Binatia bacterium]